MGGTGSKESNDGSSNKYGKAMQNVNVAGMALFVQLLGGRRHLAVGGTVGGFRERRGFALFFFALEHFPSFRGC